MTEYPTHLIRRIRHKAFGVEEKAVLMNLADRMRLTSDVVWPSVETIASDCGMSERGARYVIGWLVLVGVLVEVDDGRRTRSYRIDFDRLSCLPENLPSRSRKEKDRHRVPPDMHEVHPRRHAVQGTQTSTPCTQGGTGEQGNRHRVPPRPAPGAPEGSSEGTKKEPVKEPFSARVTRRSNGSGGELLSLNFGQPNSATATSIPAMDAARPEPTGTMADNLGAVPSLPPVKGNVGAKRKKESKPTNDVAKELTPEQWHLRRRVSDCWYIEFERARGVKPSFDGKNLNECRRLLEKFDWNADIVCEIIANAFRQKTFVEFRCKLSEILINTTQYQGTPKSERRASSGQVFANPDRWDSPLEDLQS